MFDAIIITGGNIQSDFALDFLKKNPYKILAAADGGLKFCQEHHLTPDLAVGDFDSVPEALVRFFEEKSTEIIRLCPEKDDSDTQSLLNHLIQRDIRTCALLGATGTRLDHVLANIELLAYARSHGLDAVIYDPNNRISIASPGETLQKSTQYGKYISLFPLGGPVTNLTLEGFYYPLTNHTLTPEDCGLTISNEITAPTATIHYTSGTLLLFQTRD